MIQTKKLILTCYPYKILKRESCNAGQLKVVLEDFFVSKQDKPWFGGDELSVASSQVRLLPPPDKDRFNF